jgi:peroxiredoxin (alkyl hydroperoxide reductase subunit C)
MHRNKPFVCVVDPRGAIRFASVNDLAVGRNPHEVLRELDPLQPGALCACSRKPGEAPLQAARARSCR